MSEIFSRLFTFKLLRMKTVLSSVYITYLFTKNLCNFTICQVLVLFCNNAISLLKGVTIYLFNLHGNSYFRNAFPCTSVTHSKRTELWFFRLYKHSIYKIKINFVGVFFISTLSQPYSTVLQISSLISYFLYN